MKFAALLPLLIVSRVIGARHNFTKTQKHNFTTSGLTDGGAPTVPSSPEAQRSQSLAASSHALNSSTAGESAASLGSVAQAQVLASTVGSARSIMDSRSNATGAAAEPEVVVTVDPQRPSGGVTVDHRKEAGVGYSRESPLYEAQEDQRNTGVLSSWNEFLVRYHYLSVGSVLVYGCLVIIVGVLFQKFGDMALSMPKSRKPPMCPYWTRCGFEYSILDVGNLDEDWPICLLACCCPIIRWAATASKGPQPFMAFWPAVAMMLVLAILTPYTLGVTGIVILFIIKYFRSRLRRIYNHSIPMPLAMCSDCSMVMCFFPCTGCCTFVQEAREVEFTWPRLAEWP